MLRAAHWSSLVLALLALAVAPASYAGTQDFRLVNETGIEIYSVYVSAASNDSWEEDLLGDRVLPDGDALDISFSGHEACLWDLMVTDDEDGQVTWEGLNLCQSSVVTLLCNDEECWAEFE